MVWILLSNSTGRRITKLKNYLVKIRACKSLPRIASCWSPAVHQRAEESVVGNKVFLRRSWRKINFASIRTEFSVDFLPLEKATTGKSRKRLLVVLSRTIHSPSFITLLDGVSQEGWVRFIDLQCEGKKKCNILLRFTIAPRRQFPPHQSGRESQQKRESPLSLIAENLEQKCQPRGKI